MPRLQFSAEGYALLYAVKALDTRSVADIPDAFPRDIHDQLNTLKKIATQLVDFCYTELDIGDRRTAAEAMRTQLRKIPEGTLGFPYCTCMDG